MKLPLSALVTGILLFGCGASTRAVYEGDVRFEHCMALDAQPTIKPSIRRQCWLEWIAHYTYGQTRDRVVHAQLRISELGDRSDFVLYEPKAKAANPPPPLAAPEPTSALAPPPMMASGSETAPPSRDVCAGECRSLHEECTAECTTFKCRRACSADFRACLRRCS
jgi:hypothetical protein